MKSPLRRAALRDYRSCFRSFGLILAAAYIASTTVHAASLFNPRNSNLADVQSLQSSPDGAVFRVSLSPTLHQGQGGTLDSDFDGNCYTGGFLWAVPNGIEEVDVQISDPHWRTVGRNEISDSLWNYVLSNPLPLADVSNIMVMRGMSFVVFAFNALQITESNDGLRLCEQADIELRYRGTAYPADTRILSASFYNLARGVCSNLDEVIPAPQPVPESYLIIANPAYTTTALSEFTHWKRAQGHSVTVVTTEQTGTTNQLIKAYIQNAYNTWPEPPVFVLLVGDVDNPHPLPTWSVAGYYHPLIASDHPYTLLEGTDYLPEVFIGRFSVDNTTELQTVVNKCINYERTPYEPSGEWRRSMLITGVRSTPTQFITYNSAWPTLEWIGRQFLEAADYTNVYAVPNPPGSASQISQYINSGVSFIAYRGYGSPSGWAYPAYELSQISALSNGSKLPFIASIVCGGGAFESTVDPCFGELWLRAGTPLNPKGAIGFIGPSEIDTKTRWNNTNIAGIFQGILFENVQTQAAAMLRGKLELFHEFPNNVNITEADADRSVQFYFNCYNLMGDPGLAFFVGNARHLTATIPSTLPWGTPSVTISVTENGIPLPEVWGTVMRNQEVISRAAGDQQGIITLDLPQTAGGEVTITLTKPRHETLQSTVNLGTQANAVGASLTVMRDDESHGASGNGDGLVNPGERLALGVVLHNYGTNGFNGGILSVSAVNSDLTPISSQLSIPTLAVGANSDTLWFPVDVTHSSMDGAIGRLEWTVNPGSWTWQTTHEVYAPSLVVSNVMTNGGEGNPPPLSTSNIAFQLTNQGRATISPFTAQLHSEHQQLIVNDSLADYPAIAPGMSAYPSDDDFNITSGSYYPGDWAPISINIENLQVQSICSANLPVGNLTEDDPSHPDDYGYRVFQSNDTAYQESPAYAWMEIDPTQGGAG
ncbi:MAG: C25 family cysteine peptidase, partial [Calditrichota bacterium]